MPAPVKQVIVVRRDLNMSPGKTAAQVAHAAQQFMLRTLHSYVGGTAELPFNAEHEKWRASGETLIVLACEHEAALEEIYKKAYVADVPVYTQIDEGRTEVEPDTLTCVVLGPANSNLIDSITSHLRLL